MLAVQPWANALISLFCVPLLQSRSTHESLPHRPVWGLKHSTLHTVGARCCLSGQGLLGLSEFPSVSLCSWLFSWDLRSIWRRRHFPLLPVSPGLACPHGQCISFLPFPEGCVWGYAGEREENVPLESCSLPLADPVSALQDGRKHIQPFLCQSFLALRLSSQRASSCFLNT